MTACHIPKCMENYDFNEIAFFAKKHYIEGCNTIELMGAAKTGREREEIALVSLLQVENDKFRDIQLFCKHPEQCKFMDCRDRLRNRLEEEIGTPLH
ncbi:MAG: hypothetical protein KAS48_08445 [Gammaproteobacteria bacterium]|nr:hypothetical protein [Gammaproteobacteria bacterium]